MMDLNNVQVTTGILWQSTALFSAIALVFMVVAVKLVPSSKFHLLKTWIVVTTFFIWFLIWFAMASLFWDSVYMHFFPAWSRWFLPLFIGLGFAAVGYFFWHLARQAGEWAVLLFIMLGGLMGPVTHIWALFRGIVTKPPMLKGASPLAAIVISLPEFIIYFSIIVCLAALVRYIAAKLTRAFKQ